MRLMKTKKNLSVYILMGIVAGLCHISFGLLPEECGSLLYLLILGMKLCGLSALGWFILQGGKSPFWQSWAFGFGYFTLSLYWISIALTVELDAFWFLIPIAFLGIPAALACFFGGVTLLLPWQKFHGWRRVFIFTISWVISEYLRSLIFGWPLLGTVLVWIPPLLQWGAWGSVYGLSALLLLSVGIIFSFRKGFFTLIVVLIILTTGGLWRLFRTPPEFTTTRLLLVQPNIPQSLKWDPAQQEDSWNKLIRLTTHQEKVAAVIWPESAMTRRLTPDMRRHLFKVLGPGTALITGFIRYKDEALCNSIGLFHVSRPQIYDKHHLVPFGEYIPFRSWIEKFWPGNLRKITRGMVDFSPGSGLTTFITPEVPPFSPVVCYEIIFGVVPSGVQPRWILNVTNDAWFGATDGPVQHLEMARLRAVESGLPVVRVANTGITAIIDPTGRLVAWIPYGKEGILEHNLPTSITER